MREPQEYVFLESGMWTKPEGATWVRVEMRAIAEAEVAGDPVYRFSTRRKLYNVSHGMSDAVVGRLLSAGLVTIHNGQRAHPTHHLTEAGRAYLNAH